jgi:hypothetical protein
MLLIGFANTTDNPAYFRRLNSFSVQHTTAGHGKFLPTWSRPRGRHAPDQPHDGTLDFCRHGELL